MRSRSRRGNRVHRAHFHAGCDHAHADGDVAVDHDLRLVDGGWRYPEMQIEVFGGPGVAGLEQVEIRLHDLVGLMPEDEPDLVARDIEVEGINVA